MPNHLHILLHVRHNQSNINTILGNAKRFFAYEIVERLTEKKRYHVLRQLSDKVNPQERLRKKKHRVFEVSSDIKICYNEDIILQKLEYIHANPVSGKWNSLTLLKSILILVLVSMN